MTSISVVIGTYGDHKWRKIAERAEASAHAQTVPPVDVISSHHDTLHEARNVGAERATGEFLVFLDADDELDVRYIEAMSSAISLMSHSRFLYQPATLGIVNGKEDPEPVLIPERPLNTGNFMVIGTAVSRDLFMDVGGLYRGLDGSETPFADDVVDLCSYVSDVQGVMLRHVLEHNDRWQLVLKNALDSATWRLVIILFTPMAEQTHEITRTEELDVPDLSFSHDELMLYFNDFEVRWEDLTTNTQYGTERIYYLERT